MNWQPNNSNRFLRFVANGYEITAADPREDECAIEPWWVARTPAGVEIGSGYGDAGLAKCKQLCVDHAEASDAEVQ